MSTLPKQKTTMQKHSGTIPNPNNISNNNTTTMLKTNNINTTTMPKPNNNNAKTKQQCQKQTTSIQQQCKDQTSTMSKPSPIQQPACTHPVPLPRHYHHWQEAQNTQQSNSTAVCDCDFFARFWFLPFHLHCSKCMQSVAENEYQLLLDIHIPSSLSQF